jgi:hypothetical protein
LYTDFAHPLKLHDAKLEIFFAAGHGDKETVESVWSDIIEDGKYYDSNYFISSATFRQP